ncbi:hypothetical protein MPER_04415, partial [Moniliophthora perniciosa FA553]
GVFAEPTIWLWCVEEKARAVWEAGLTESGQDETSDVMEVEGGCRTWFNVGEDVPEDTEDLKRYLEKLEKDAAEMDVTMNVDEEKATGDVGMSETTSADPSTGDTQSLASKLVGAFSAAAASVVSIPDSGIVLYDSEKPRSPKTIEDLEMAPPSRATTAVRTLLLGAVKGPETTIQSDQPPADSPTSAPETDSLSPATVHIPNCAIPSDAVRVWPSLPVPKGKVVGQVDRDMHYLEPEEEVILDVTHEHVVREVNEQKSRTKAAQDEKEKAGKPETQWLNDIAREVSQRQSKETAEAKPYQTFVKAGTESDDKGVKYLSYTIYTGEMRTIHINSVPWLLPGDAKWIQMQGYASVTPKLSEKQ